MFNAYCFFTYRQDRDCLLQAIRSIRLSDPRGKIAVFDDGRDPLSAPVGCDYYEQTWFERHGNLNGRECIMAEVLSFAKAARLFGAQYVAKVDCDTVVVRPLEAFRLIRESRADLYGASWHDFGVWGPFYLLRASILPRMLECVNSVQHMSDEEDMGMTALVRASGGQVVIVPFKDKFFNGLDYRLKHFDFERFRSTNAITCGNRMQIQSDDVHGVVARAMEGLVDYLHEGRVFDWDRVMIGATVVNSIQNSVLDEAKKKDEPVSTAAAASTAATASARAEIGPSVAVIVIGHNTAQYLAECLDSVFAQSVSADEVIYVDDASEDDSVNVAGAVRERGLKIIRNETNLGMCATRMAGVAQSTSQLLLFVDSDNVLPPDFLRLMIEDIQGHDFVYPSFEYFGEGDRLVQRRRWFPNDFAPAKEADRGTLWKVNYADTCSLRRRDAFLAAGGWQGNAADTMFDWDLALRMSARGPHARSRAVLRYRVHDHNWSERERGRRQSLNGLVRRHAASLTVAVVWSGRVPELAPLWLEAVMTSLLVSQKTGCELLVLDDSAAGFPIPVRAEALGAGSPFSAINARRIHSGADVLVRRRDRRQTAEFLSAACNDILRLASGDVIWFIEDDVIVPPQAADKMLFELLQVDDAPHTAVAGCYRNRHKPDEWVACNVENSRVVHLAELPANTVPVQMTGTGCMMVLRDLLRGIRFGAEWRHQHMRTTGHDWNLAWELHERGTPVRLVPSVVCRHHSTLQEWF